MALSLTPTTLGSLITGTAITDVVFSASGGTGPYQYSIQGTLPRGLTFTASTGTVSGTPVTGGSYSFNVLALDTHDEATVSVHISGSVAAAANPFENSVTVVDGLGVQENRTLVTVATGKKLTVAVNGVNYTYDAGATLYVPTFEVQYLRRDGMIV